MIAFTSIMNAIGSLARTGSGAPGMAVPTISLTAPTAKIRIDSVDLLRGLIMVIMMLDHTRDFVHRDAFSFDPADVSRTFPVLFFTRWITHFCAPLFVFLAGTSVYFQEMRGRSKGELSRFLITRGLWLIAVELVVLRPLIFFNFHYEQLLCFMQVIWVIGCSMIVLAAAIHLPLRWSIVLSLAVIALHNLLDGVRVTVFTGPGAPVPGFWPSVWHLLHQQGPIFPFGFPGPAVFVVYPLIPWPAVMLAGYAFGALLRREGPRRRRSFLLLGGAIVLGFVIVRFINLYGDPVPWTTRFGSAKTLLSFLALTKYPPSLLYLMMTIGPGILFLAFAERHPNGALTRAFITFGRVPLFFYLLQWATAHGLAVLAAWVAGKPVAYLFSNVFLGPPPPPNIGFSLPIVYALWILGVILIYPLCVWFVGVKARRRDWWISYV
jgi:uncharacterized membrane protein